MADVDRFLTTRLWTKSETRLWTANFFLGTCVLYASRGALPICTSRLALEYSWSKSESGTIISCFFWGYTCTQFYAGRLADRIGGERILASSTLLWSLLTLFTPILFDCAYWSGSPFVFLLALRVATGVGQGFHVASMASIISRHSLDIDKGRVFGISLAGAHLGSIIAGAFGSLLLEVFGWRSLFYFVGTLSVAWWAFFTWLTRPSSKRGRVAMEPKKLTMGKAKQSNALLPLDARTKHNNNNVIAATVPWGTIFSHRAFWAAAFTQYCGANAYFTMFSWLPSYFSDNFPHAKSLVYNVVPHMSIACTSLIAPMVASRLISQGRSVTFTRRVMEGLSLLLVATCLVAVSTTADFASALFFFSLAMASRGLHHGGVAVNIHDIVSADFAGAVYGIFNAFSAITGFVGVYAAGWILQATHDAWSYVFLCTALQCVLGAICFCLFGSGIKIV